MSRIGQYEVVRPLGAGGMAETLLARTPEGTLVVLKRPLTRDASLFVHLRDEARAGTRLRHPNIVETKALFELKDGTPVLVLGYIPGVPLDQLIRGGKLRTPVILRIGRQIADALGAIHNATSDDGFPLGMVHRDVSPSNIVLGLDGDARLIDLGIARSRENESEKTQAGFLKGKVKYLAPELFHDPTYTPASDLWALGVTLFELALGRSVVRGGRAEAVAKILGGQMLELDQGEAIDPRLFRALSRLLDVNPKNRLRSAKDVAALFSMLERDFGDTRTLACASLPALSLEALSLTPPESTDVHGFSGQSIPEIVGALLPEEFGSQEETQEFKRPPEGLQAMVSSWFSSPVETPRDHISRYIEILRGFEVMPQLT